MREIIRYNVYKYSAIIAELPTYQAEEPDNPPI
jgi:hypothetical protein